MVVNAIRETEWSKEKRSLDCEKYYSETQAEQNSNIPESKHYQ